MKKHLLNIALCLLILVGACQTQKWNKFHFPTEITLSPDRESRPAGKFPPERIVVKDGITYIDFMISARRYTISSDNETSRMCIQLIKKALNNCDALEIFTLKDSNEIAKIRQLPQEERDEYKKNIVKLSGKERTEMRKNTRKISND